VRIKHNQPQNLSPNSHRAIDTIHRHDYAKQGVTEAKL